MQSKKAFYQSRTILGAILMLVALVASMFRVEISEQELAGAEDQLNIAWEAVAGVAGFLLTLWGRIQARRAIGFSAAD